MRDFIRILKRFVPPYKKYMVLNIVFNVLSAILNLFSFALIIPILQILFKMDEGNYTFMDWNFNAGSWESWKALPELIKNNFFLVRIRSDRGTRRFVRLDYVGNLPDRGDFLESGDHVSGLLYDDPDPDRSRS